MKTFVFIVAFFFSSNLSAQVDTARLFYSDYALTQWKLMLFPDSTFTYTAFGHAGFNDTIKGIVIQKGDSVFLRRTDIIAENNFNNRMSFVFDQNRNCLVSCEASRLKFCLSNNE